MPGGAPALAESPVQAASVERLRKRSDFLGVARRGRKAATRTLVLQARPRETDGAARIGYTVSRKVGNAVERNRVRRRLREAVRTRSSSLVRSGYDYVIIGRRAALTTPFGRIVSDLETALRRVHATPSDKASDR
jgi:ribonuclease P protein component